MSVYFTLPKGVVTCNEVLVNNLVKGGNLFIYICIPLLIA